MFKKHKLGLTVFTVIKQVTLVKCKKPNDRSRNWVLSPICFSFRFMDCIHEIQLLSNNTFMIKVIRLRALDLVRIESNLILLIFLDH